MGREVMFREPPPADERVAYGPHPSNVYDLRFPSDPHPPGVAVFLHGGFWRRQFDFRHAGNPCAALTVSGLITANVEYRRTGEDGAGWPGTFDDVLAAIHSVRSRFNRARAVVVGHSAGGHLALWAAGQCEELAGAVGLGAVACLKSAWKLNLGDSAVSEFLGGSPLDQPERYRAACPAEHPSTVPRILIHGTEDTVVPVSVAREFLRIRAADPGPVDLLKLAGVDHFDVITPESEAWAIVRDRILALATGLSRVA